MLRERVSEDIYVFTSELYAQVTAGLVLTEEGSVVVDTLPFPQESKQLRDFARRVSGPYGIRYVINTHFHADHVYGNYLFPEAEIVAQRRSRHLLERWGKPALEEAKKRTPELAEVTIRLPGLLVEDELTIHLGDKTFVLIHYPGNTVDGLGVYVEERKVLFAGDVMMTVPYIVNGDPKQLIQSLQRIKNLQLDALIQGHGPVLLKGEIPDKIALNISYLRTIDKLVDQIIARKRPRSALHQIGIEACGIPHIALGGIAQDLHEANLLWLYNQKMAERRNRQKQAENNGQAKSRDKATVAGGEKRSAPVAA